MLVFAWGQHLECHLKRHRRQITYCEFVFAFVFSAGCAGQISNRAQRNVFWCELLQECQALVSFGSIEATTDMISLASFLRCQFVGLAHSRGKTIPISEAVRNDISLCGWHHALISKHIQPFQTSFYTHTHMVWWRTLGGLCR